MPSNSKHDSIIKGQMPKYESENTHDLPCRYDALLGAGDSWEALCSRGMFHSGDSDSTGVIAAACFGALYGFHGVPEVNYKVIHVHSLPSFTFIVQAIAFGPCPFHNSVCFLFKTRLHTLQQREK